MQKRPRVTTLCAINRSDGNWLLFLSHSFLSLFYSYLSQSISFMPPGQAKRKRVNPGVKIKGKGRHGSPNPPPPESPLSPTPHTKSWPWDCEDGPLPSGDDDCHWTLFLLVFFVHFRPNFTPHSLPRLSPLCLSLL